MKKRLRNEDGITLISLVVTIVILIILAVVSINLTLGENGIITKAKQTKNETEIGKEKEEISLAYMGAMSEKLGKVTASDMDIQLKKSKTNAEVTGNIIVEFLESNRFYKIDSNGNILGPYEEKPIKTTLVDMYRKAEEDNCINEYGTCTNEEHLHIGDYVDYKNPTEGIYEAKSEKTGAFDGNSNVMLTIPTQTFDVSNNQLNWRVLGVDNETGGLKLIAGSPMKQNPLNLPDIPYFPGLLMYGAYAYEYGTTILDEIGGLYKTEYAQSARSVKIEDINQVVRNNN